MAEKQQRRLGRLSKRFWELLLKTYLEVYKYDKYSAKGMCYVVDTMRQKRLITGNLEQKFDDYLKEEFKDQTEFFRHNGMTTDSFTFIWNAKDTQPRIDYIQSKIDSK